MLWVLRRKSERFMRRLPLSVSRRSRACAAQRCARALLRVRRRNRHWFFGPRGRFDAHAAEPDRDDAANSTAVNSDASVRRDTRVADARRDASDVRATGAVADARDAAAGNADCPDAADDAGASTDAAHFNAVGASASARIADAAADHRAARGATCSAHHGFATAETGERGSPID